MSKQAEYIPAQTVQVYWINDNHETIHSGEFDTMQSAISYAQRLTRIHGRGHAVATQSPESITTDPRDNSKHALFVWEAQRERREAQPR